MESGRRKEEGRGREREEGRNLIVAERAKRVEPHSQIMLLEIELFWIWSYIHRILRTSIHACAQIVLS